MDDLLARSAEELFARHADASQPAVLLEAVEEAGFLDALVPEAAGGIGLGPAEALPILLAAGRFAVRLPLGETMLARAALAAAGVAPPPGLIGLAEPWGTDAARLPPGPCPDWALWPEGEAAMLLPLAEAMPLTEASAPGGAVLRRPGGEGPRLPAAGLLVAGAWQEVAVMAGAMERILEDTLRHARDRQQFGRPVAAFQAVQQQLSVLTEDVFATRMAAQLASVAGSDGVAGLDARRVAAAKLRAGEAACRVAGIAHAVQGAMGITEEVALHRFTGRLQAARLRFGGEAYWAEWLGRQVLADDAPDTLGFVRAHLGPALPETSP
ncbi:acyl-CoA dehydrogenase family protein [Teichococcus oryzae]|uniref:Acyl-CoA dehydrogenase family protein n=1 Tax=Teichococcus oryzae TaxID=1608942 RepID=A0A5B2TIM6_9PROT|nr:acyl-CoA dehydrogenase family protein [Pseudoroseomonas oryzae]KAA2214039.1 acyl-CoA dehydrogenase family protein [Pseudoroseomonas oryzae]